MDNPDNTPMWVAVVVTLAGTLGVRELAAQWLKQRGQHIESDHDRIKDLEDENKELRQELSHVKSELAQIKGIVSAWAMATDDEALKEIIRETLSK